jgi:hypothetical protein
MVFAIFLFFSFGGLHKMLRKWNVLVLLLLCCTTAGAQQTRQKIEHPYPGIALIQRTITPPDLPRAVNIKILQINLKTRGLRFKLSPRAGKLEVVNQPTLDFLVQEGAQFAVNSHFYLPVNARETNLIGLAASVGDVYSGFEAPEQTYAIVDYAPGIAIDAQNHAKLVHCDRRFPEGKRILEKMKIWNALSGSSQIVTNGAITIPVYKDDAHPQGRLTPGSGYSNAAAKPPNLGPWYDVPNPRTAIGLSKNNRILTIFVADGRGAGGSYGLTGSEMALILIKDLDVYNAINLDGGGSTTLTMKDPESGEPRIVNVPSDKPPRSVGSSLAIFAAR